MKTLITVKCQMCGREFWARSITRKYCPECLQKRHDECNRHSKPKHVFVTDIDILPLLSVTFLKPSIRLSKGTTYGSQINDVNF